MNTLVKGKTIMKKDNRTEFIHMRVTPSTKAQVAVLAKTKGISVSRYMCDLIEKAWNESTNISACNSNIKVL